ncbi:MAG: hypothetical protein C0433_10390 [Cyclobacterium sp.]|nr:hypothetical protein [Cyclobacterium sp.]
MAKIWVTSAQWYGEEREVDAEEVINGCRSKIPLTPFDKLGNSPKQKGSRGSCGGMIRNIEF